MKAFLYPWLPALALVTGLALAAGTSEPSYIEHRSPPGSKPLPFSDAVLTENTLHVAGHIGIDPGTGNPAADPATEAHQVIRATTRPPAMLCRSQHRHSPHRGWKAGGGHH